ncbi:hypothetical protein [Actinophytocola sp.]|uniref:hypothetical protein n=1 Tax=Actinophytocola sp. TaxID=1872138 RepID=UPI002ED039A6
MTNYPPSSYPPGSQPPPYSSGHPSYPFPAQPGTPPQGQPHPSFPFPSQPRTANFPDASTFSSYYSPQEPTPQPTGKSRSRLVLTVVAVVMFVAAGVLGGLYIAAGSAHEKATSTLQDKKSELTDVRGQVSAAKEEKSTAEQNNSDLETKNGALQPCVEATQRYLWDGLEGEARTAAISAMIDACS